MNSSISKCKKLVRFNVYNKCVFAHPVGDLLVQQAQAVMVMKQASDDMEDKMEEHKVKVSHLLSLWVW